MSKYIMKSHADYTKKPLGSTYFFQVFDGKGYQRDHIICTAEEAIDYATSNGLTFISPAKLLEVYRSEHRLTARVENNDGQ